MITGTAQKLSGLAFKPGKYNLLSLLNNPSTDSKFVLFCRLKNKTKHKIHSILQTKAYFYPRQSPLFKFIHVCFSHQCFIAKLRILHINMSTARPIFSLSDSFTFSLIGHFDHSVKAIFFSFLF